MWRFTSILWGWRISQNIKNPGAAIFHAARLLTALKTVFNFKQLFPHIRNSFATRHFSSWNQRVALSVWSVQSCTLYGDFAQTVQLWCVARKSTCLVRRNQNQSRCMSCQRMTDVFLKFSYAFDTWEISPRIILNQHSCVVIQQSNFSKHL